MNEYPGTWTDPDDGTVYPLVTISTMPFPVKFWNLIAAVTGLEYSRAQNQPGFAPPSPIWQQVPDFLNVQSGFTVDLSQYCTAGATFTLDGGLASLPAGWGWDNVKVLSFTSATGNPSQTGISVTASLSGVTADSNVFHIQGAAAPVSDVTPPTTAIGFNVAKAVTGVLLGWLPCMDPNAAGGYTGLNTAVAGNANAAYVLQRSVDGGSFTTLATIAAPGKGIQFTPTIMDIGSPGTPGAIAFTGNNWTLSAYGNNEFTTSDSGTVALMPITGDFTLSIFVGALTGNAFGRMVLTARAVAPTDLVNGMGSPFVSATLKPFAAGTGGSIDSRASQGATPTNFGGDKAFSGPTGWWTFTRRGNVWTEYLSTAPGLMGQTATQISQATITMPGTMWVGIAGFGNGAQLQGSGSNLSLSTDPVLIYADTTATGAHSYSYKLITQDGGTGAAINQSAASVTVTYNASSTPTLQAVLAAFMATGTLISGHWTNVFSSNPIDIFMGTNPSTMTVGNADPTTHVLTSTGKFPGILLGALGTFGQNFGNNCTPATNIAVINAHIAAGGVAILNWGTGNPSAYQVTASGTNCFSGANSVLNPGTALYNAIYHGTGMPGASAGWGGLDQFISELNQITGSVIIRMFWEGNLGGGSWWYGTGGVNTNSAGVQPTNAQYVAFMRAQQDYINAHYTGGHTLYFVYSFNNFSGAYTQNYFGSTSNGVGDTRVQFIGDDYYGSNPASDIPAGGINTVATQYPSTPLMMCELGGQTFDNSQIHPFTIDNSIFNKSFVSQANGTKNIVAAVIFCQNWFVDGQLNGLGWINGTVARGSIPAYA